VDGLYFLGSKEFCGKQTNNFEIREPFKRKQNNCN